MSNLQCPHCGAENVSGLESNVVVCRSCNSQFSKAPGEKPKRRRGLLFKLGCSCLSLMVIAVSSVVGLGLWTYLEREAEFTRRSAERDAEESAKLRRALATAKALEKEGNLRKAARVLSGSGLRAPTEKELQAEAKGMYERLRTTLAAQETEQIAAAIKAARERLKAGDIDGAVELLRVCESFEYAAGVYDAQIFLVSCLQAGSNSSIRDSFAASSDAEFEAYMAGGELPNRRRFEDPDLDAIFLKALGAARPNAREMRLLAFDEIDEELAEKRRVNRFMVWLDTFQRLVPGLELKAPVVTREAGQLPIYTWSHRGCTIRVTGPRKGITRVSITAVTPRSGSLEAGELMVSVLQALDRSITLEDLQQIAQGKPIDQHLKTFTLYSEEHAAGSGVEWRVSMVPKPLR